MYPPWYYSTVTSSALPVPMDSADSLPALPVKDLEVENASLDVLDALWNIVRPADLNYELLEHQAPLTAVKQEPRVRAKGLRNRALLILFPLVGHKYHEIETCVLHGLIMGRFTHRIRHLPLATRACGGLNT